MDLGLSIIFYYGVLHALSPDHLVAISNFSIGQDKKIAFLNTLIFTLGHGSMLFIFAFLLQKYNINNEMIAYGDIISASIILIMGCYFLYMVFKNKIQLRKHIHKNKEHIHIWFGDEHNHKNTNTSLWVGMLMGISGVRGMLITLGAVQGGSIDWSLVFYFGLGVMIVFINFGFIILYINKNLLNNKTNIKRIFATMGILSVLVALDILT